MELLFSFFSAFMYQFAGIFVANILFVLMFIFKFRKIRIYNKNALIVFVIFIIWVLISTGIFAVQYHSFTIRNFVQLVFNIQYVFLATAVSYNHNKLEKWYIRCSMLLSAAIFVAFIYTGSFRNIINLFGPGRMWAEGIIPGWPNSTAIPLLYALFIVLKEKEFEKLRYIYVSVFFVATMLTTSRSCILGAVLIIIYFCALRGKSVSLNTVLKYCAIAGIFVIAFVILIKNNEWLAYRFSVTWDRQEIFGAVMEYTKQRPLIGYGGNSFDIVFDMFGSSVTAYNWGHTHNTVLEFLLRYGVVGLILFCMYLFNIVKSINDRDTKYFVVILLALSLAQIYIKNFVFLGIIFFAIQREKQICNEKYSSFERLENI